jgi:hypothetical protein
MLGALGASHSTRISKARQTASPFAADVGPDKADGITPPANSSPAAPTCATPPPASATATAARPPSGHYADPVPEVDRRAAAYLAQLTAGSAPQSG